MTASAIATLVSPARWALPLAWVLVLALAAWFLVGWFWRFVLPPPPALVHADRPDPVAAVAAITPWQLFGLPAPAKPQALAVPDNPATIWGVMTAGGGRPGVALLGEGEKARAVVEGEDIRPGLRLSRVLPDGVIVGDERQKAHWPLRRAPSTSPAMTMPRAASGTAPAPSPAARTSP
jgi:hypothetical protein